MPIRRDVFSAYGPPVFLTGLLDRLSLHSQWTTLSSPIFRSANLQVSSRIRAVAPSHPLSEVRPDVVKKAERRLFTGEYFSRSAALEAAKRFLQSET